VVELIEARYALDAANQLRVNLDRVVQIYNAAETLPNLINPFWMLPVLGLLNVRARELVGYSVLQFVAHVPVVLFLLWIFVWTLPYIPPSPFSPRRHDRLQGRSKTETGKMRKARTGLCSYIARRAKGPRCARTAPGIPPAPADLPRQPRRNRSLRAK